MGGTIVSASVGNGAAGGMVIAEPQDASYAAWPSFTQKTLDDIISIFADNLRAKREGRGGVSPDFKDLPAESSRAKALSAIFTRDTFILIAILGLTVFGVVRLAR